MSDDYEDSPEPLQASQVAARVRQVVRSLGSKAALSAKTGIPDRTIGYLLAGQDAKLSQLARIANATNTRLEWLATGRGPMREGEIEGAPAPPGTGLARSTSGFVAVPRYDVRAAAGHSGSLAEDGAVIQRIEFSERWLRTTLRRDPRHLVLLEAAGDSMAPTIGDGDVLMLDLSARDLVSGRIYVLQLDGELLVKRVQRRLNGSVLVLSDNTLYPPEEVPAAEPCPLRILGEVVWHARAV